MKLYIIPLHVLKPANFSRDTVYDHALIRLHEICQKKHGYFMVYDSNSRKDLVPATYRLRNCADLSLDVDGAWFLGRIHTIGPNYRIAISVNDPAVVEQSRTHTYARTLYTDRALIAAINELNHAGSMAFRSAAKKLDWDLRRDSTFSTFANLTNQKFLVS